MMATVGSLVVRIGADVSGLTGALNSAKSSLQSFGAQMKSAGAGLTAGVTAPLVGVGVLALKSAADFETSMNQMQATTGATAGQMDMLEAQALSLGASTSFSAGEAAGAMLELAKAGMSVEQTSAAIGGVMDLAAAGGIGLAQAATITANALNSFGLEADQATRVANTFAAAANASSADVTDLAAGFQMAGAVFASNKQSVEDLAAALAILSNNGIAGSDAGTSLKTMMMRLAAPTAAATAVIADLGIKVYDAQGAMLPFGEIVGQLQTSTAGLTDEQRNMALSTIFGADAIRAATILAGEGAAGFDTMKTAVSAQGAASTMAQARMKGLGGAIEYFKGSIDSLLIGAALPFMDTLSGMVKGAADLIGKLGTLTPAQQRFAAILAVVAAAAGPVLMVVGSLATALGALLSPITLVVVGVAALGAAWATNFGGVRDTTMAAWAAIQPVLQTAVTWLQENLPAALATLQAGWSVVWGALTEVAGAAWAGLQPIFDAFKGLAETLALQFTSSFGSLGEIGANIQSGFVPAMQALWTTVVQVATALAAFFGPAVGRLRDAIASLAPQITALLPQFASIGEALGALWTAMQPIFQLIGAALAVVADAVINLLAASFQNMTGIVGPILDTMGASVMALATIVQAFVTGVVALVNGDWTTVWASAQTIVGAFGDFFTSLFENIKTLTSTIFQIIYDTVINTLTDMGVNVGSLLNTLKTTWDTVWGTLAGAIEPVVTAITGVWDKFSDFVDYIRSLSIPNPFAGWDFNPFNNGGGTPGNAVGTPNWTGGMTLVGEFGPELVSLPQGSRIWGNGDSEEMMGGGGARVVIQNVNVAEKIDVEALAYRVATTMARRGWGRI